MLDLCSVWLPPPTDEVRARWLAGLGGTLDEVAAAWELAVQGEPERERSGLVVPVHTADGGAATLTVRVPTEDSEHEALALRHWAGRGAARLLRADPHRRALVRERVLGPDLVEEWDLEACRVVGGLYADLHIPAPPRLTPVTAYVERWRDDLAALPREAGLPRRLVEQALSLARSLIDDPASVGTLLHGDLRYGTVRASDRSSWLAVDPRPVSGDPHAELAPMLWHRWREVSADAGALRWTMRERFAVLVEAGGLDEDRARAWSVLRLVAYARWAGLVGDRDELTAAVRIIKAVGEP